MKPPTEDRKFVPGDVFQISEKHGRAGWTGAFVMATEIKSWGVQGFVHMIYEHDTPPWQAFIRLPWEELEYVGLATLVPTFGYE